MPPVVTRLSALNLPLTGPSAPEPFSSSSGQVGTQDKPISLSSSGSSERHYLDTFGRFHSDVEPDSDVEERVHQSRPRSAEWFRANRILSYRRRKGNDFYLV